MKVPSLDLRAQLKPLEKEIKAAIDATVESTQYILGPKVEELEQRIAELVGARFGVGVSSGTDALLAAMMALEIGADDLVLTTPYSFFSTASCVTRVGATPVFIDIDPDTYNMDASSLRSWLETETRTRARVKAILPVHLFGQCADMDPILAVSQEYGIPIIEDAAQALGAEYPSRDGARSAGSMGLLACFSFYPSKNLGAMGDAGMIVTSDEAVAHRLRMARSHGADRKYHHRFVGGNFRLDPIQAAILAVKLPHLEGWSSARRGRARYYDQNLQSPAVKQPALAYDQSCHIYNQYVISVSDRRDDLQRYLAESEIGTAIYYPVPLHEQECFAGLGYRRGDLPFAERAARHTLALPLYPELTRQMQDFVIERVEKFYA